MLRNCLIIGCVLWSTGLVKAQKMSYFVDGYHGGIYGHLPPWQTHFMVEQLGAHPDWKINLELEPESWDTIALKDSADLAAFKLLVADQSADGRVEYINPSYGQSYLYTIGGESIIRQFYYGMRKLREHFPGLVFSSYSSEEPCFTSALPQILLGYGISYASLKNPNTCWGGYTRNYGGELVNWVGPDGSKLITVPRYKVESLKPKSTWETIASNNSVAYISKSFQAGIQHPVGMCLQDAGWNNGPWIKPGNDHVLGTPGERDNVKSTYHPFTFVTWRGYIEKYSIRKPTADWHFSQEDVLTSLVWGGQILQRIAQQVRAAENRIVATEKLVAIASVWVPGPAPAAGTGASCNGFTWPTASFDEAWRTLLLAQHHDCWIVPYNQRAGMSWADYVVQWTSNTQARCDTIAGNAFAALEGAGSATSTNTNSGINTNSGTGPGSRRSALRTVRVVNTTLGRRVEVVSFKLPEGWKGAVVTDRYVIDSEVTSQPGCNGEWLFKANVPSLGESVYFIREAKTGDGAGTAGGTSTGAGTAGGTSTGAGTVASNRATLAGAHAWRAKDGHFRIETDQYSITLDPARGGAISKLIAKKLNHTSFTDPKSILAFGEMRGNFYKEGGFHTNTEDTAAITILENGPLRVKIEIQGKISTHPFTQTLTLTQAQPRIDIHLDLNWEGNTGIGQSPDEVRGKDLAKAFYNDSFKLQALFPVPFAHQHIYKNAPFDVLQSHLDNTFFHSWDSIKNVVILNWVDVTDEHTQYGLAMLTDHTTSYAHGPHYPLGLTLQYSGDGLFYRNYTLNGPSSMNYALIPHMGKWDQAHIWTKSVAWNEPLIVDVSSASPTRGADAQGEHLVSLTQKGAAGPETSVFSLINTTNDWEVPSVIRKGNELQVRFFNAQGSNAPQKVYPGFAFTSVRLVDFNGKTIQTLTSKKDAKGKIFIELGMPRFGIRTLQFSMTNSERP